MNIHESEQVDYRPPDEVTQTIVDAVQLFAPASPLVALRVVYFPKREGPEVQQFHVRAFPVVTLRQQTERRYRRDWPRRSVPPPYRTHDEFTVAGYRYLGQFVTLRCLFATGELDPGEVNLSGTPQLLPLRDERSLTIRWEESFHPDMTEPFICLGAIVNPDDVEQQTARLKEEAKRYPTPGEATVFEDNEAVFDEEPTGESSGDEGKGTEGPQSH